KMLKTRPFMAFFSTMVRSSAAIVERSRMGMRCLRWIIIFPPCGQRSMLRLHRVARGPRRRRFRNSEARFQMTLSRSTFLKLSAAVTLAGGPASAQTGPRMHTRKIPSTGELLPVVGCGTWRTFDVGAAPAERAPLAEVLSVLFAAGGSVIDSSPMYGKAE